MRYEFQASRISGNGNAIFPDKLIIENRQKRFLHTLSVPTATYDENDPLREQFWQMWVHREVEMNNELMPKLSE